MRRRCTYTPGQSRTRRDSTELVEVRPGFFWSGKRRLDPGRRGVPLCPGVWGYDTSPPRGGHAQSLRLVLMVALVLLLDTIVGCARPTHRGASQPRGEAVPVISTVSQLPTSKPAAPSDPLAASMRLNRGTVRAGGTFAVTVVLDVAATYEIYPQDARPPAVPTRLELALPTGLRAAGQWSTPPPQAPVRSQAPGGHRVYAGRVSFVQEIHVADDAALGEHEITCTIHYQACDERQCLPPRELRLGATVSIDK